jgi:hypothetical protein
MLKKGTVTLSEVHGDSSMRFADIAGIKHLHIGTQAELDMLHNLVREGEPLPLKPAPGSKPPKR